MTDWSRLTHAYGTAEDVPRRLDRLAAEPDEAQWNELWSALCHQGTTFPASLAALARLADLAEAAGPEQAGRAVALAGAILAAGGDAAHREHAGTAGRLAAVTNRLLPTADGSYPYLLECLLTFEGVAYWSDALAGLVRGEEHWTACPACGTDLVITLADEARTECVDGTTPVLPAARLAGVGRRLHDLVSAHGRHDVARVVVHVFGQSTCPACEVGFEVASTLPGGR